MSNFNVFCRLDIGTATILHPPVRKKCDFIFSWILSSDMEKIDSAMADQMQQKFFVGALIFEAFWWVFLGRSENAFF